MGKARLEAFTDGVLAIVITIMVLELKVPHGLAWAALAGLSGKLVSYVLSFLYIGIYWNNHHNTMQVVKSVDGSVLWSNLHLLFWLSLLPFTTGWLGENHFARAPMILYGVNLVMAAVAYLIFVRALVRHHGADSAIARAVGKDRKGKISVGLYVAGIALSMFNPWLGFACYVAVALGWLIPDRRMAKALDWLD